jgi:hypothetical protein
LLIWDGTATHERRIALEAKECEKARFKDEISETEPEWMAYGSRRSVDDVGGERVERRHTEVVGFGWFVGCGPAKVVSPASGS